MKSEFFEPKAFVAGTPSLMNCGLVLPRDYARKRAVPDLHVLPAPETNGVDESWVVIEMRQRTRYDSWQDALFLILAVSGSVAIILAFFAIYA
jgi:hypothetical protein